MIDYVIDLNNRKNFVRKNFPGRRYTYPTYKGSSFFFFILFFFTFYAVDEGAAQTAEPISTRNTSFDAVWFLELKISVNDLDLEKVKIRHFVRPSKC